MLRWVLFGVPCHGLIEDENFNVIKCNNDNGQPELTFTIEEKYFEDNLSWQADQEDFILLKIMSKWKWGQKITEQTF